MEIWNSLSPDQKLALIKRDIDEGLAGPTARNASLTEILSEALARADAV